MMDSTFRNHSTSANLKTHRRADHWATLEEILLADPSQNFLESETISAKRDDFNLTRTPQGFDYEDGWVDKKDDTALCASRNQSGRSFQEVYCPSIEYPRNSKSEYQYHSHSRLESERPVQYYTEQVANQLEREDSYSTMIAEDILESPIRFQAMIPAKQLPNLNLQADNAFDLELDFLSPMPKKAKQIQEDHSVLLSTGISGCESTPSRTMRLDSKFQGPNDLLMSDATIHQSDLELESLETQAKFPRKISNETGLKGRCEGSKTLEQELAEFNPVCDPCGIDNETLEYLYERERDYAPDPFYLKNKQSQLTWSMRAILIDWMLEVSMEFTLKRETFHAAVNYVDRFLSLYPNLQRQELQLIGVVSLFTSAKNEEIFSFQAEDFAKACDGAYTTAEIVKAEGVLLKTLKWMLVPPTFNSWSQWYLSQWDLYIEKAPFISNQNLSASVQESLLVQFRQPNERSYTLFREFMQYIDCIVLDIEHLQYDRRTIIAALMYLLLGKEYQQFSTKQIVEELRTTSTRLFSKSNAYNDLFADFLTYSFGFELEEILPSLQYVASFFLLPLNYDLPRAVQIKGQSALEGHFEDFLSYQTHHRQALEFLRNMKAKGTP